LEASAHTT
jgi:transposase